MTAPVRVLIVDDEPQSQRLLRAALTSEGYRTMEARTAFEALSAARARTPDVVLLELALPDADGTEVIKSLRRWSHRPIIVVSARGREKDKVAALELGADDYVTKPFSMRELMGRIRVALRHEAATPSRSDPVLCAGDLKIDLVRQRVFAGQREVHLTPHEYDLLVCLMKRAGKVVTHPQLLKEVWGPAHMNKPGYLRVCVGQLRRKLEIDPARPRYLLTEPRVGYRFKEPAREGSEGRSSARSSLGRHSRIRSTFGVVSLRRRRARTTPGRRPARTSARQTRRSRRTPRRGSKRCAPQIQRTPPRYPSTSLPPPAAA